MPPTDTPTDTPTPPAEVTPGDPAIAKSPQLSNLFLTSHCNLGGGGGGAAGAAPCKIPPPTCLAGNDVAQLVDSITAKVSGLDKAGDSRELV